MIVLKVVILQPNFALISLINYNTKNVSQHNSLNIYT